MTLQDAYAQLKIDKKKRTIVVKELRDINLEKITAGIHASDGNQVVSKSGFKLIDVAVQNEYGNSWVLNKSVKFFKNGKWWYLKKGTIIKIPATKFVSRVLEEPNEKRSIMDVFKGSLHILLNYGKQAEGYTAKDLVKDVGSWMRDRIRAGIDNKIFEPNGPLSIAIKGFDKRLFEVGTLYNSIKFRSKKTRVEG